MSDCKRNMTRRQMYEGLKAGRTLMLDRRDAPELPDLQRWEEQGFVTSRLVEFDEQSSALKWRWIGGDRIPSDLEPVA